MKWISVDERLPEVGEAVIAYFTIPEVHKEKCMNVAHRAVTYEDHRWVYKGYKICVTDWQPLPEPPEDK